jgi:hypothetical protein
VTGNWCRKYGRENYMYIVTYPGVAWLITRVLDLVIEFIGPLWDWLQEFTNQYLSSSDWTLHWNYSDFQLNCQLLLASRYITSGRITAQKAHALLSTGYIRTHIEDTSCDTGFIVTCVYCERWLEMGLFYCWLRIYCGLVYRDVP